MEGVDGATTVGDPEDPPHPLTTARATAAHSTPIRNPRYRVPCAFSVHSRGCLDCIIRKPKRVPKTEQHRILKPLVTCDRSRLAHTSDALIERISVFVPVRESPRSFIDTPVLKVRHDKFTSGSWNRGKEINES